MDKHLIIPVVLLITLVYFIIKKQQKVYNTILFSIVFLMPFYQNFFHYRHFIVIIAGAVLYLGGKSEFTKYTRTPIVQSMIVFFCVTLLSAVASKYPKLTITPIIDLISFYFFFSVCLTSFNKQKNLSFTTNALAITLVVSVLVQTMQLLGFESFYIYDPEKLNANTGLSEGNETALVRFWGTFGNSLTFSSYLSIIGIFLFTTYHRNLNKKIKSFSYLVFGFALYSILLTSGRTALMALGAGVFVYCLINSWKKTTITSLAIIFLLFIFSDTIIKLLLDSGLGMVSRFTYSGNDKDFRLQLWTRGLSLFLNNPLLGIGPGNLTIQIAPIIKPIYDQSKESLTIPWGHVENSYLSVLYTFGVLGFSCFFYMLYKSFIYCYNSLRVSLSKQVKDLSCSLLCTWIVIYINMVSNPAFVTDYRMISLTLFFVALSLHNRICNKALLAIAKSHQTSHREHIPQAQPVVSY